MKRFSISLLILFTGINAMAQQAWHTYNTQNSGIPDNDVYQVAKTSTGAVWVATEGGLAKFDGTAWTTFTTANGLPDNSVRCVFVDPADNVWAGTFSGGMVKYDGNAFTVYNTTNSGLPNDFVRNFAFEAPATIWIATGGGLGKLKNDTITAYDLSLFGLESNTLASIAVKANGVKVVGMVNGGFSYYNDTTFTFYTLSNSSLPDNTILSISLDEQDNPYMAMPSGGIIAHFGGNIWQLYNNANIPAMTTSSFRSIAKDTAGTGFWAGSFEQGLVRYNGGADWQVYKTTTSGIADDHIQGICAVNGSEVWVGTEGAGLVHFEPFVGIAENTIDNSIKTYYAGDAKEVVVSSDAKLLSAKAYSIDGRLLAQVNNVNATKVTLPVNANGLVIVHCITTKGVGVRKLVVE